MATVLRPYQEDLKAKIYNSWDSGIKNVLAVMPTGGGKTRTFCSIAIDKAVRPAAHLQMPTAIMVHRKELVQQICLTLAEEGIPHNIIAPKPVIMGIIGAERQMYRQSYYNYRAAVTVISVDTLNSRILKHQEWAKSIKLWITDEAAHLLRENKWGQAVGYFPNAIGLGVTATPERLDKRGLGRHADGVFDVMVEGPGTKWMIDNEFLCKYKIVIPESDYRLHLKESTGDHDYSKEAMIVASQKSKIVGDAVANYQKFAKGKQAIVFATDIGTSDKLQEKFLEAGVIAKSLSSFTEDSVRLRSLIEYRDKKIQVLINVDLFDEGLDVPGIECVIMARPTKSLSKFLQMIGRGLRPAPNKPFLILIDHVGNVKEHGLPDNRRKWTLDRIIRRKKKINLLRICINIDCNSPFDRLLSTCPYCGTEDDPKKRVAGGSRPTPEQVDGDLIMLDPETLREMQQKTVLEDPAVMAQRVSFATTGAIAKAMMQKQRERIDAQDELKKVIAQWAGNLREYHHMTDRMIHKKFYLQHELTIWEALSLEKEKMLNIALELKNDI